MRLVADMTGTSSEDSRLKRHGGNAVFLNTLESNPRLE
jgi:hypothetical protein